jgi:hypothetical protein
VAEQAAGAKIIFLRQNSVHVLIGVQAPLHQRVDRSRARHRSRFCSGLFGVCGCDDAIIGKIDLGRAGNLADLRIRSEQDGLDEAMINRLCRAQQCVRCTRVDDTGSDRLQPFAAFDQLVEVMLRELLADLDGWRGGLERGFGDHVSGAVGASAVQQDDPLVLADFLDGDGSVHGFASPDWTVEPGRDGLDHRARAGQLGADYGGE